MTQLALYPILQRRERTHVVPMVRIRCRAACTDGRHEYTTAGGTDTYSECTACDGDGTLLVPADHVMVIDEEVSEALS